MSSTHRHPGFPARPLLRPGVRICRREDGHLQVGLASHLAVVAPDVDEVRQLLAGLRNGVPPGPVSSLSPGALRLCSDLLDRGLVMDADDFFTSVGARRGQESRESLSAFFADNGSLTRGLLERRRQTAVRVEHRGLPRAGRRLSALLETGGTGSSVDAQPDLAVLVTRGETDRDRLDDWVRADLPHLLVSSSEGVVRVGPFVVPGHTACLRCVDAHHADTDPRRPLILTQYADPAAPRDGLPDPIHHDLLDMALLWASRDLLNWIDGKQPTTWSATITLDPTLDLRRAHWAQHPACGCGWGRRHAV
ncbi:hypothetical protein ncot_14145 [Nocardioides sp. JQ2195]|uniref:hypothetical protein n=1 Tax=Nocardioides sp. JQ2195 TaxID=2592334 RepID=UPI00143EC09E|nr:hypothetical protein [Nocardioides sp. JQ2195]QIX27613.1 hypothetical protein ncot_14145 [Nocardioides sp. JQ2195]